MFDAEHVGTHRLISVVDVYEKKCENQKPHFEHLISRDGVRGGSSIVGLFHGERSKELSASEVWCPGKKQD